MNRILPLIVGLAWLGAVLGAQQRPGTQAAVDRSRRFYRASALRIILSSLNSL